MDLLSLAESILRTQADAGLTAEQRKMVQEAVKEQAEEIMPSEAAVPERPALAESEFGPEVEVEEEQEPAAEPLEAEPVLAAGGEEEAGVLAPELDRLDEGVRIREEEEEQVPPFVGEPVEDSTGWVQVESKEDYYSGWADGEESWPEVEFEWVRDEIEEDDVEEYRPESGKKKGKKREKRDVFEEEAELESRRGRKRGRSHSR
jgi:hypothetical protein